MLPIPSAFWSREAARAEVEDFVVALVVVLIIVLAACLVQVRSGEATIITRFGNPVGAIGSNSIDDRLLTINHFASPIVEPD